MAFSSPRETVRALLAEAVAGLASAWGFAAPAQVAMERTKRPEHGDFATNVALTLGADGSILMHGDQVYPIEGVGIKAVDTTGAGDMYAAGVLYGLTHGMTWKQAGQLASHAAARVVSQMGARLDRKFTHDEVRELAGI